MANSPFDNPTILARITADVSRIQSSWLEWNAEPTTDDFDAKIGETLVDTLDAHARAYLEAVDGNSRLPEYQDPLRRVGSALIKYSEEQSFLSDPYSEDRLREIAENSGNFMSQIPFLTSAERESAVQKEVECIRSEFMPQAMKSLEWRSQLRFRIETRFEARYRHWTAEAIERAFRHVEAPNKPADTVPNDRPSKEATLIDQNDTAPPASWEASEFCEKPEYVGKSASEGVALQRANEPENLGLLANPTQEFLRPIEAHRQAEQDSPESARRRHKREADTNAQYSRLHRRNPSEAARQEELLRDAREYVAMSLTAAARNLELPRHASESDILAACDELRDLLVLKALNEHIPLHKYYAGLQLGTRDLQAALWTEGFPSLEDQARAAIQKRVAFISAEVAASNSAGKKAAPMKDCNLKAESESPNATPESGERRQRGRPLEIADDKKVAAAKLKAAGGTNKDAAALLYDTKYPTVQQKKNVSSILRYHKQKSKHSSTSGKPRKASSKPNKNRG
jgi:hypothetical protein